MEYIKHLTLKNNSKSVFIVLLIGEYFDIKYSMGDLESAILVTLFYILISLIVGLIWWHIWWYYIKKLNRKNNGR